ncbi:glucose-1-phosphate cytidylyltransferase [Clostridium neonatale]|uniref:glucose-1-phosphate cytidylyltransferase n=1 Tax=Clostridium neonatale TaxID=137838 RepID=UPI003D3409C9
MKVVILAGGYGTRISEESHLRPKPMIEIGGYPMLWHIMKIYSYYGFNEFIICCGYKGYMIKEYFADYYLHRSDVTFDFTNNNEMIVHNNVAEPWKVTLIDTGIDTMTGGRIKRIEKYIGDEPFMLTYGDGVSDVNVRKLMDFHNKNKKTVTITAIQPGGRFGVLDIGRDNEIKSFTEKSKEDGGWINGGFMVLEPDIFNYIHGDKTYFEREPLENLAKKGQLSAYKHKGFWQCMDTQRDKNLLEELWKNNMAKWKVWD